MQILPTCKIQDGRRVTKLSPFILAHNSKSDLDETSHKHVHFPISMRSQYFRHDELIFVRQVYSQSKLLAGLLFQQTYNTTDSTSSTTKNALGHIKTFLVLDIRILKKWWTS